MDGLDGMWHVIVTSLVEEGERQREKECVCMWMMGIYKSGRRRIVMVIIRSRY